MSIIRTPKGESKKGRVEIRLFRMECFLDLTSSIKRCVI